MEHFRPIHRDDIQAHLKAGTSMHLLEALPEKYYKEGHLPGAKLAPPNEVKRIAKELLPNKDDLIVVYCANASCQNSKIAANTLVAMGYNNVAAYEGGKQDWVESGLSLDR